MTVAEVPPKPDDYPGRRPAELLVPGSLVFHKTAGPVDLRDYRNWWAWMPGADWRHPEGPGSTVGGREQHPVTHVAYSDARRLRGLGRQVAADRGGVGVRRPRRARRSDVHLGRGVRAEGADDGQHVAGRVPLAEPPHRRLRGHLAGRALPRERLRPLRHGRQRLGVDGRRLGAAARQAAARAARRRCRSPATARSTRAR